MFVHKSRLPHVLRPQLYSCPEQFNLEQDRLFRPVWHLAGATSEAEHDGDFFTRDLAGVPILVRNSEGIRQAFLNVCPHRHCMLTHAPTGHQTVLTCQYHGWEFTPDGKTAKIPDAQSFRPMPGGPECLQKFPTEVRGNLIFVTLNADPEPLDEQLGPLLEVCHEFPGHRWKQCDRWSYEFNANWKVVVENTVESYHVAMVHPTTLVRFGREDEIEHVISENATIMRSTIYSPPAYRRVADLLLPLLQTGCRHHYNLYHGFPNFFLIRIDAMLQVMIVEPLSPETCRLTVYVFVLRAERETLWSRLLTSSWGRLKSHVIKTVLAEDAGLYPDLQRGMKHSPFQGTISTREELVYAFQNHVFRRCDLKDPVDLPTN